jgi:hypothetical protein
MSLELLELLDEVGRELVTTLYHREDPSGLLLAPHEVLEVSTTLLASQRAPSPKEALTLVTSHWEGMDVFAPATHQRLGNVLAGFTTRLDRLAIANLDPKAVTPAVCEDFLHAPVTGRGASQPSIATMHLRRAALRAMFTSLRALLIRADDPTLDLRLPPRVEDGTRPVTSDERDLLRLTSVTRGWGASMKPTAVALTEGGAWPGENAAVRIVDLLNRPSDDLLQVRIAGCGRRRDRHLTLTEWGSTVVRTRAHAMLQQGAGSEARLTYGGERGPARVGSSVGMALRSVFTRAGLGAESDLAPKSLVLRAALDRWEPERQNIAEVANLLGVGLDRAAAAVRYQWVDTVDWDETSGEVAP